MRDDAVQRHIVQDRSRLRGRERARRDSGFQSKTIRESGNRKRFHYPREHDIRARGRFPSLRERRFTREILYKNKNSNSRE